MRGIILLLVISAACGCGRVDAQDNCNEWVNSALTFERRLDECEIRRATLQAVLCHDERRLEYCSGE